MIKDPMTGKWFPDTFAEYETHLFNLASWGYQYQKEVFKRLLEKARATDAMLRDALEEKGFLELVKKDRRMVIQILEDGIAEFSKWFGDGDRLCTTVLQSVLSKVRARYKLNPIPGEND